MIFDKFVLKLGKFVHFNKFKIYIIKENFTTISKGSNLWIKKKKEKERRNKA